MVIFRPELLSRVVDEGAVKLRTPNYKPDCHFVDLAYLMRLLRRDTCGYVQVLDAYTETHVRSKSHREAGTISLCFASASSTRSSACWLFSCRTLPALTSVQRLSSLATSSRQYCSTTTRTNRNITFHIDFDSCSSVVIFIRL